MCGLRQQTAVWESWASHKKNALLQCHWSLENDGFISELNPSELACTERVKPVCLSRRLTSWLWWPAVRSAAGDSVSAGLVLLFEFHKGFSLTNHGVQRQWRAPRGGHQSCSVVVICHQAWFFLHRVLVSYRWCFVRVSGCARCEFCLVPVGAVFGFYGYAYLHGRSSPYRETLCRSRKDLFNSGHHHEYRSHQMPMQLRLWLQHRSDKSCDPRWQTLLLSTMCRWIQMRLLLIA